MLNVITFRGKLFLCIIRNLEKPVRTPTNHNTATDQHNNRQTNRPYNKLVPLGAGGHSNPSSTGPIKVRSVTTLKFYIATLLQDYVAWYKIECRITLKEITLLLVKVHCKRLIVQFIVLYILFIVCTFVSRYILAKAHSKYKPPPKSNVSPIICEWND